MCVGGLNMNIVHSENKSNMVIPKTRRFHISASKNKVCNLLLKQSCRTVYFHPLPNVKPHCQLLLGDLPSPYSLSLYLESILTIHSFCLSFSYYHICCYDSSTSFYAPGKTSMLIPFVTTFSTIHCVHRQQSLSMSRLTRPASASVRHDDIIATQPACSLMACPLSSPASHALLWRWLYCHLTETALLIVEGPVWRLRSCWC